jgi:hypothetical protein
MASLWFLSHLTTPYRMQPLDISSFGLLKSSYDRERGLFMRSHPYETNRMEEIPSLLSTACIKNFAAIAKRCVRDC